MWSQTHPCGLKVNDVHILAHSVSFFRGGDGPLRLPLPASTPLSLKINGNHNHIWFQIQITNTSHNNTQQLLRCIN